MSKLTPVEQVETRAFECMAYDDLPCLLADLDEHGSAADRRGDSAECKRTINAITAVEMHCSEIWLTEDWLADTSPTLQ